ncbi:acetyl-coenzyme A transporter 1-like [Dreissena polymorpha]|uniref:Acetyl-coenzyme A transporter 1 n=1 Tax=Dreissena polymorpha TaxID=45954 RepID=A0A9D4JPK4_DREPO|nr:acetyl-coenzyme A transporter 1-like [Dreissena polymorpha]KAH3818059.1 hypothetical protein DPMN_119648 [Dreissena polymorpha]
MSENTRTRSKGRSNAQKKKQDIEDSKIDTESLETSQENYDNQKIDRRGLQGDYLNILLLTFLYVLQGIPLGLGGSLPMLLQSRKVSYSDQAKFSFVHWPFSIKLLWAPLVDAVYVHWMGRRKTWLVPIQYLIGVFMLTLSTRVDDLLGTETSNDTKVDIFTLTVVFFCLNFLAATQDIAVDGWALTMLARRNVGWASTCNTVGQTAGYFLGNVLFVALESADFCNKYLRSVPQDVGIVTLSGFLYFWGLVFFISTTLVWIFKSEKVDPEVDPDQSILETYKQLYKVIRLKPVIAHCMVLLTVKVTFAAADALSGLKLIEAGMPKTTLAIFAVPMVPIQIILPLLISRYTSGPRPMKLFTWAITPRILMGLVYAYIVYIAHYIQTSPGVFPTYFYLLILGSYAVHQVFVYCMFVSVMGFHAKVSDPVIGGTYMTLLNTVANLGGTWPTTVALWAVDTLTWKSCDGASNQSCYTADESHACKEAGGTCITTLDGYYLESALCIVIGFLWLLWGRKKVKQLDDLDLKAWKVS